MLNDLLICSVDMRTNVPWTPARSAVYHELAGRRGRREAISIAAIIERVRLIDRLVLRERDVKAAVSELRLCHGLQIGSSRRPPAGYYLIADAADLDETCRPYERQAVQMWRTLRALRGPGNARLLELAGQLTLEARE